MATIVMYWTSSAERGSACGTVEAQFDVTGDGCLTVADVQTVATHAGLRTTDPSPRVAHASDLAAAGAGAGKLIVTSTGDGVDIDPGDGVCSTSSANCSLRAAIEEANAQPGRNRIAFRIPGAGPHVIRVQSELPVISDETGGTTIDGYSQPGARVSTDVSVSNAVIMIQLDGPRVTGHRVSINGFQISSPNNIIRGLAMQRFKRSFWISGAHADNNIVAGNFIGSSASGQPWYEEIDRTEHLGGDPGAYGVWISYSAKGNRIGGANPADRNVISGNANDGIGMRNDGTEFNLIIGNLIGLSPNGQERLRNYGDGIDLNYGAAHNQIGDRSPRKRNVISGNMGEGIEISHDPATAFNQVINNHIGVSVDGLSASTVTRNSGFAISLEDGVSNNTIGPFNVLSNNGKGGIEIYGANNVGNHVLNNWIGVLRNGAPAPNTGWGIRIRYHASDQVIGPDNRIGHNTGPAVYITDHDVDGVTVTRNRMFANGGLGIDIEPEGVNLNDTHSHNGANRRMNFPELLSASQTQVVGTSCAGCTVELYEAESSAGQYGEGKRFVGAGTADANGHFTIAIATVKVGRAVTATATDSSGNTSEFSLNKAVSGP